MAMRYYAPLPGGDGFPAGHRESPWPRGGPHALRIGDAERDAAAADLGEHYAAGRLTLDELHERLDAVFSSKTFGQLTRIMADLPGPVRLGWRAGPGAASGWAPADLAYGAYFGMAGRPWHTANSSMADFQTREPQAHSTPTDRAGRFAALSLLLIAMLIWLFTALLFARHGFYHPGPYSQPGSFPHYVPQGGFQFGAPARP
jgi:hypothetical protein